MTSYSMMVTTLLLCGFLEHTNPQGYVSDRRNVYRRVDLLDIHKHNITGARNSGSKNPDALAVVDQMKNFLKLKCDKDGSAGAFEKVNRTMYEVINECTQNFNDIRRQSQEIERHIPCTRTKEPYHMLERYCRYTPVLNKCVSNFTLAIEPCLNPKEKENKKVIQNITDSILDFVCFKEGYRITLFISVNGPECLESKQQEIQQCVNTTFGSYLNALNPNNGSLAGLDGLPLLVFGAKECTDSITVQSCIVNKLKECSNPAPANLVDSLFDVILEATPCKEFMTDHDAASTSTINLLTMSILFLVLRLI